MSSAVETSEIGIDSGVINTTSASFELTSIQDIAYHIKTASGTLAGAQFIIECSDNDSDWYAVLTTLTTVVPVGVTNIVVGASGLTTKYVRIKAYAPSTGASTIDLKVVA